MARQRVLPADFYDCDGTNFTASPAVFLILDFTSSRRQGFSMLIAIAPFPNPLPVPAEPPHMPDSSS
jgi:hypothetical protein